jgi:histidine ammonia-lyase
MKPFPTAPRAIVFGAEPLTIEDILAVAQEGATARLPDDSGFRRRIQQGSAFLDRLLEQDGVIYGVTTGYGDSCTTQVPTALVEELPLQLARFHGCGLGALLAPGAARAVLATRLVSLCRGYSGVRLELLERLVAFLNLDVTPLIPEEGSVGASGDLTPLSYVAALLVGERDACHQGVTLPAAELHRGLGLQPLTLRPKEGLAVMNGTAVMTALACEAFARADYLGRLTTRLTALASMALAGNRHHFDERLCGVKPHPGVQQVASWLRRDLNVGQAPRDAGRLQDRYSIRCAPHVIGVLQDSLPWMRSFIENELNSVNDNPVIDGEAQQVLHGGHFYGGHIAFVMDSLKACVANLADLMDRQLALLVDVKFNHGLPANLSGASPARQAINHGFKGVQIGASAWAAEALKLTMPASVFSRSTECHNQDKVSMGTIAARDCLRVLQLTEQVAAAGTLAVTQAALLRRRGSGGHEAAPSDEPAAFLDSVLETYRFLEEDRPLEPELRRMVTMIQQRHWPLYT